MGTVISGGQSRVDPVQTFKLLDQIITTLGSTKTTLFPFMEASDDLVRSYKENYHTLVPTSNGPGFDPFKHPGGLNSYLFDPNYSMYLLGNDHGDYTFKGSGNEDEPFSVGMWILPYDVTAVTLMAKYDTNSKREWRLYINGSSKLVFEFYDESQTATETGTSTTSVTANQWTFVVHTYDGTEDAPVVAFYQNATADATVATTEAGGTYINMEDLTAPLTIGADLVTDVPAQPFNGRIALPFVAGKKLSAAEVTTLYGVGRTLIGV